MRFFTANSADPLVKIKGIPRHILQFFFFFFFFYLGFTALSRIFHLYQAVPSSKAGKNRRKQGKNHLTIHKQNLAFPRDPSEAQTTAVRNLMDKESALLSTRLRGPTYLAGNLSKQSRHKRARSVQVLYRNFKGIDLDW